MAKALIYARQSSGDEEVSASVEQQILNCKRLAEENDITVVGVYSDLNISGKTYPDTTEAIALAAVDTAYKNWVDSTYLKATRFRKGLAGIVTSLKNVDYVILDDFTRLMRPLPNSYLESHVTQKIKSANVKIWCVKGGISDLSNFADNLVATLISQINSNQLEIQRQKAIAALKNLRDSGYRTCGGDMYGYKHVKNKQYEIEPQGAIIVRKAFEMTEKYVAYNEICRTLASIQGKDHFSVQTLKNILSRPEYAGYQYNSENELIESKCFCKIPLITLTQFRRVSERLKSTTCPHNHDRKEVYAFTGLCYCGYCGGIMFVQIACDWSNSNTYTDKTQVFRCKRNQLRAVQNDKCRYSNIRYQYQKDLKIDFTKHKFSVQEETLNNPVIPDDFRNLGLYEALMPLVSVPLMNELKRLMSSNKIQERIQELEAKKREIVDFEANMSDMLFRKVIDVQQFESMVKKHNVEKEKITQEIVDLTSQTSENKEEEIENIKVLLYLLQLKKIDKHLYKKHAQAIIKRINVFYEKVEVIMKSGESIVLKRIPSRRSRVLPDWSMSIEDNKIKVTYYYKSYFNGDRYREVIFDSEQLKIETIGKNPPFSKKLS